MAVTVGAARLTEAHRVAQARIGAATVVRMRAVWPLLDPSDIDGTVVRWLNAATPIIEAQRIHSTRLAETYLSTFKSIETGGTVDTIPAAPAPLEQIHTSLTVTGPYQVRHASALGTPLVQALLTAEAAAAAAALRHALNGGRDTILGTVAADPEAIGWARVARGRCCAFCAMLASRGPVYTSEGSADFHAHDSCACAAEPVYETDAPWPPHSRRFADVWSEAKAAEGDTTNNFRRLIEAA